MPIRPLLKSWDFEESNSDNYIKQVLTNQKLQFVTPSPIPQDLPSSEQKEKESKFIYVYKKH